MKNFFAVIIGVVFVSFTQIATVAAQSVSSQAAQQVQGTVKDALGRPLAGVDLRLRTPDGRIIAETKSGSDGRFAFPGVEPGTYAVLGDKPEFQTATAIVTLDSASATANLTMAAEQALDIKVAAERLDRARNGLSPRIGSSQYRFDADDVQALPQGDNTPFNEVLLQAPGVVNDSFGQLHIRGDHGNIQYRINGVILPEGITGFGQALDTRFASRIDLLTGALPAQYGYRTAGVIDINTKSAFEQGGRLSMYGGSRDTYNPSFELSGAKGPVNYYVTGSLLESNIGIENPAGSVNPIHDHTNQSKGFAYFSVLPTATTRVSMMLGTYDGRFQIPNNPNQTPDPDGLGFLAGVGLAGFDSATLKENQREVNRYGILAVQSTLGEKIDYQIAAFERYTSVLFTPDPVGDLVFNGVASRVFRNDVSRGIQGDGSMRLNDFHTLRSGVFFSNESIESANLSTVFPVDATGNVTGAPFTINDSNPKGGNRLAGIYLQDEWKALDKLTVNYGVRLDHMNAFVSAGQVSPRLGAVYQWTPQTTLHAAYSRYFTPPPTELVSPQSVLLFQGTSNGTELTQNDPVLPERTHYYDIGVTHQLTPSLNLGIDAYYKDVTNLIDEGQFGQALVFSPFNYRKGKVYGVELTANYKKDNFGAYLNIARSAAFGKEIISGQFNFGADELAYVANNWVHLDHDQTYTASSGASYMWRGTRYGADAIYGSGLRSGFANTDSLSPYFTMNVSMQRRFDNPLVGKINGRLAIVNLFDKTYELRDGSGIGVGAPQFGPRRGVYAGVSKAF